MPVGCGSVMVWLLVVVLLFGSAPAFAYEAKFDRDVALNCEDRTEECNAEEETFYECSATCRRHLQNVLVDRTQFSGKPLDPDGFYELEATTRKGTEMSFERFDGFVVIFAAIPLMPGVGNFYFDLLERLVETFSPHTIEVVVLPILQMPKPIGPGDAKINYKPNSKLTVLNGWIASMENDVLKYLAEAARMNNKDFNRDAVTVFVRSFDGTVIKAAIFPSISDIREGMMNLKGANHQTGHSEL